MNLINEALLDELDRVTAELAADPEPSVVVLKSANPDFFVAHAEFANLYTIDPDAAPPSSDDAQPNPIHRICERLRTMDKITIAQVEGRAGGGGAGMVMACDLRFGAIGKAIFNTMGGGFGTIPGGGTTQYLPRLVGRSRALELIVGGIDLDAVTAERWGFLNRALPADEIEAFVDARARRMASCRRDAARRAKLVVDAASKPLEEGLREENLHFFEGLASADSAEYVKMFLALGGETVEGEIRLEDLLGEVIHAMDDRILRSNPEASSHERS
jgi:enoyl-CoA hydratase/carnithine racemase